jgi:hypothetical protein
MMMGVYMIILSHHKKEEDNKINQERRQDMSVRAYKVFEIVSADTPTLMKVLKEASLQ